MRCLEFSGATGRSERRPAPRSRGVSAAAAGCLISLEGGEGSGKSSQCRLLLDWLAGLGVRTTSVREPGGTEAGERLRAMLLDPSLPILRPETEVLLFAAARAEAVAEIVRPALAAGEVVVCDRFVDSSLAYQGFGLGADLGFIRMVNTAATGGLRPVLTVLLDVPPAVGARRRAARGRSDRVEMRGTPFHSAVREGYLRLAAGEPERFAVVDGTGSMEAVQAAARRAVLGALRRCGHPVLGGADG